MIEAIPTEPVGLPGLAVLGVGICLFGIALLVARARRKPQDKEGGQRAARSWGGIFIQMLGIAVIGFGPIDVALDPMGGAALGQAAVVTALMAGAIWLFGASTRAMGRNWAIVAATRSDHQLVTSGPFAYVRNPIYVALLLVGFAFAVGYGHYAALVPGVPLYLLGTMMRVRIEERLLRARFGAAYDAYWARVKRFIPGIV